MKKLSTSSTLLRRFAAMLACMVCVVAVPMAVRAQTAEVSAVKINPTTVDVVFGNERMTFDFYGDNIFRLSKTIREASSAIRRPRPRRGYSWIIRAAR